jgi:hypothetical protein
MSEAAEKMSMYENMMESLTNTDDSRFILDGKKKNYDNFLSFNQEHFRLDNSNLYFKQHTKLIEI